VGFFADFGCNLSDKAEFIIFPLGSELDMTGAIVLIAGVGRVVTSGSDRVPATVEGIFGQVMAFTAFHGP
jgi:hypothetical protein